MNEPCCNAAKVMAGTAKEVLAEKDADIAFRDSRINDLQDEIDRLRKEIQRMKAGDSYRSAVITEMKDRLQAAGELNGLQPFCESVQNERCMGITA